METRARSVMGRYAPALCLFALPACWAAEPVVYLGGSSASIEVSVANTGNLFAELSVGRRQDLDAAYSAIRVGARTLGASLYEVSAGLATVGNCAQGMGDKFVPSVSLGTGFREGRLQAAFYVRYIQDAVRDDCSSASLSDHQIIGLAGVGYRF